MMTIPLEVFCKNNFLANVLLFAEVESRFHIAFETEINSATNVHINDGTRIRFNQCIGGVYYYDTKIWKITILATKLPILFFLNVAHSNKSYFHKREIKGADAARILQNW